MRSSSTPRLLRHLLLHGSLESPESFRHFTDGHRVVLEHSNSTPTSPGNRPDNLVADGGEPFADQEGAGACRSRHIVLAGEHRRVTPDIARAPSSLDELDREVVARGQRRFRQRRTVDKEHQDPKIGLVATVLLPVSTERTQQTHRDFPDRHCVRPLPPLDSSAVSSSRRSNVIVMPWLSVLVQLPAWLAWGVVTKSISQQVGMAPPRVARQGQREDALRPCEPPVEGLLSRPTDGRVSLLRPSSLLTESNPPSRPCVVKSGSENAVPVGSWPTQHGSASGSAD